MPYILHFLPARRFLSMHHGVANYTFAFFEFLNLPGGRSVSPALVSGVDSLMRHFCFALFCHGPTAVPVDRRSLFWRLLFLALFGLVLLLRRPISALPHGPILLLERAYLIHIHA